jgi:hypothetical protein
VKHLRTIRISALLGFVSAVLAVGCGVTFGPESAPTPTPPTQPPPAAGSSGSVTISPQYTALSPGQQIHFTATGGGQLTWLVNGVAGGSAATGTVDSSGNYTAPASLAQSANFTVTAEDSSSPQNYATAVAAVIDPGLIQPTSNPQVVQYSIYLPAPGKVSIEFGPTTSYGLTTWQLSTPSAYGGEVSIYVAGMLGSTLYHMRAQAVLDDGATFADIDHDQFASGQPLKTGPPPPTSPITISGSGTPQSGIEMWNTILPKSDAEAFATDLSGNVIWTYTYQGSSLDYVQGIRLLPNGDFLMVISYLSSLSTQGDNSSTVNVIREVDLAGNTVRELSIDTLNPKLAAAGFRDSDGNPYQLTSFHHDVLALPNGHWVLLAAESKTIAALQGYSQPTAVLGDVLVDVDPNSNPDWVWSSFDHLDINRRPMNFPDWTHSNGLLYSADDHNLLLSIRHQNWIVKIDFDDGQGSGNVLWRLGEGGDFKLIGGTDPADWFYAQHGMSYFTPNTTGVFRLGLLDNGNDRMFPPPTGQVLCKPGAPGSAQCYSTVPILELNESNMTATLIAHDVPLPSYYSFFGGNVELLANGNVHADFCSPAAGAIVQELDPSLTHVVWQETTANADQFRVDRLPSLYPGVQW